MDSTQRMEQIAEKKEISSENFIFIVVFIAFFAIFGSQMGVINMLNTLMNTAYSLLLDTVMYLTAICVLMGAISALLSEFGVVSLANRLLNPLMIPLYNLPGAASVGVVTTFLSDNPAILSLADDSYFKSFFKRYQFPALTNLGTSFGMGLIVCTYMLSLSATAGVSFGMAVLVGLLGAVIGSIVSTRLMLRFRARLFGKDEGMSSFGPADSNAPATRPIRAGSVGGRFMGALLDGGTSGVKMGFSIIPGVLVICTLVMMLTNGPSADGTYTGAAYEGIQLIPNLADKFRFILDPLPRLVLNRASCGIRTVEFDPPHIRKMGIILQKNRYISPATERLVAFCLEESRTADSIISKPCIIRPSTANTLCSVSVK